MCGVLLARCRAVWLGVVVQHALDFRIQGIGFKDLRLQGGRLRILSVLSGFKDEVWGFVELTIIPINIIPRVNL